VTRQVKRAFKYRFYPTNEQAAELSRTFGCVRLVYNKTLEERTRAWYGEQRRLSYLQSSAALTAWKKTGELAFLAEASSVPLQQALRHLQTAFGNFFAQRAKYPRYKSRKKSRASAEYTRSAFTWRQGKLTLAKMAEPLDIRWSRPLPEGTEPTTVTVSRDSAGRWFKRPWPAVHAQPGFPLHGLPAVACRTSSLVAFGKTGNSRDERVGPAGARLLVGRRDDD
jgi:putative transposase